MDLILALHEQPRAVHDQVAGFHGDRLKAWISASPVDGRANEYITAFPAGLFRVPRRDVVLLAGESGRNKRARIRAPEERPDFSAGAELSHSSS